MICNAAGGLLPSLAFELRDTFGGATVLPSYGMTEWVSRFPSPDTINKAHFNSNVGVCLSPHLPVATSLIVRVARESPAGRICPSATLRTTNVSYHVGRQEPCLSVDFLHSRATRSLLTLMFPWTILHSVVRDGLTLVIWVTWIRMGRHFYLFGSFVPLSLTSTSATFTLLAGRKKSSTKVERLSHLSKSKKLS
jgi:hypothetical protein